MNHTNKDKERIIEDLKALPKGRVPLDSDFLTVVGFAKGISYSKEELERDPKLAYLVEKYQL